MHRLVRRVLGALTLVPALYIVAFMTVVLVQIAHGNQRLSRGSNVALMTSFAVNLALMLALLAVYALHALRNGRLGEERRTWLILFFVAGPIVEPVYWWQHIRRSGPDPSAEQAVSPR